MSKLTKIILAIVAVVVIVAVVIFATRSNDGEVVENITGNFSDEKTLLESDLSEQTGNEEGKLPTLISKIYENVDSDLLLPSLTTIDVDLTDSNSVKSFTGLENGEDLVELVVSEPMMNAQAYSFVLAKVKSGVDANEIAKKMSEQVDMRRWICVEAEQLYATNSEDTVCLIMADKDTAKAVYDSFKNEFSTVGEEYNREAEEIELPPDMY